MVSLAPLVVDYQGRIRQQSDSVEAHIEEKPSMREISRNLMHVKIYILLDIGFFIN